MLTEEELDGLWIEDPVQGTRLAAIAYHFQQHGQEVGAETIEQYLGKALALSQQKKGRGRRVPGWIQGVKRYVKQGRYVDIAPSGEIVSFGSRE